MQSDRRALTIREVVVVLVCIAALLVVTFVAGRNARQQKMLVADATQLSGIAQSFIVHSRNFQGIYPTPGLVDRLPVEGMGEVPGRGAEDITQNTTANLFSMCIMANYFTPEICVGPTESSSRAKIFSDAKGFNFAAYNATNNVFWDTNFKADLHVLSHVSYAHMPFAGNNKTKYWRDTLDSNMPIIGNRGPLGGVHDPNSITNKIHPPYDKWSGVIIFSDNHSQTTTTFPTLPRNGIGYQIAPECLPHGKRPPETDAAITFTKQMTEQGPIVQHD
jgi:hypothetical protein